jgi:translocation protein SEC63
MSFKDTFTKEEGDGLLGYDDTAFYYFASSVLVVVVVPWTLSEIYNLIFPGEAQIQKDFPKKNKQGSTFQYCQTAAMVDKVDTARKEAKRCTTAGSCSTGLKWGMIGLLWLILIVFTQQTGGEGKEIKRFDPFRILEVEAGADAAGIKKAYRKLSLIYHPDKNPDDPLAQTRFIEITKAYNALTDETAKRNYEKYGNPDGPQTTKMGIGLPAFLLQKDNHLMILCIFFFILLFVVPMTFIMYYQKTKHYAANGVMLETLHFLGYYINESTRVKNCPELLAASAESRGMEPRASDNEAMKPISKEVVEHKKRQFNVPVIVKNSFLIWAHMQRLHHHMTDELRKDLDELLGYSMKITQAMIEIACMREWFFTAQAMIEFRRALVQGLDVKTSQLLQVPHFTEESLKHCHRGKNAVSTLSDFLHKASEERKGLGNLSPQEVADVEAFAKHVSDMDLQVKIEVEDEDHMVVGDVATVTARLERRNLREGEAMGPVHAPLFPEPKFEEWWIFLTEGGSTTTRILAFERIRDTERVVVEKLRFQLSRPGKHSLCLHALCDSYSGLDKKFDINFNVSTEDEVKREVVVHPEDEELDLQPTLFQQFMGELNQDDDESEEEAEEDNKKKPAAKKIETVGGASKKADEDSDSDSDDDKGKAGKKDDDSSSSSDSD